MILKAVFWASLGGLAWTHVGYPVAAAGLRRLRDREVAKDDVTPTVTLIVPAHDEEDVIGARVENLLQLDYPSEKLELVVASDGSTDRTHEIVQSYDGKVQLMPCERAGKLPTMNRAVRETESEIVAFGDANAVWAPDALRKLVRNFADPEVAYVCGQVRFQRRDGTNKEGIYWRYEMWLRESESALGSITGGNGAIYAVRRPDYVEWPFGHDLGFPNLMVQHGRRAVYEPEAVAFEKPSRDIEDEYRRKVRMFEHCWLIVLRGRMLSGLDPVYLGEIVSHRLLRYGSGLVHLALLASSAALAPRRRVYALAFAGQAAFLGAAAARPGLPRYYVLVTWATVEALLGYVRHGVPAVWAKAEGTR